MTPAQAWSVMDASSSCTSPGMFWYTENMPVIITRNIHVSLGISNGKEGKAVGFVVDPESKVYSIQYDGPCEIHSVDKLPACLLVQVGEPKHESLEGLNEGVYPIFPLMSRVPIGL